MSANSTGPRGEDLYTSTVPVSEFECQVCLEVAEDAVETNCCHVFFCDHCISKVASCPICRVSPLTFTPCHAVRRIIGNIPIRCRNEGCDVIITRFTLKDHKFMCEYRIFRCSIAACNFQGKRGDLLSHLASAHSDEVLIKLFDDMMIRDVSGSGAAITNDRSQAQATSLLDPSSILGGSCERAAGVHQGNRPNISGRYVPTARPPIRPHASAEGRTAFEILDPVEAAGSLVVQFDWVDDSWVQRLEQTNGSHISGFFAPTARAAIRPPEQQEPITFEYERLLRLWTVLHRSNSLDGSTGQ